MPGSTTYPPRPPAGPLRKAWDLPFKNIVCLPAPAFSPGQKERHSLYSLLLLALVAAYWNGNKYGPDGNYPWRQKQKRPDGTGYLGGDYQGHNIGCIGVDGQGRVIDFDFNHNNLFDSSVEHAESRLVRRIFSLAQLNDEWMVRGGTCPPPAVSYGNILSDVTLYTSLESCSQCSGIMSQGSVKEVVFLQSDPGQKSIGNILYKLGALSEAGHFSPPLPIPANLFGCDAFQALQDGFAAYVPAVATRPFFIGANGAPYADPSIAAFLCTDEAYAVFSAGAQKLKALGSAEYPTYRPKAQDGSRIPGVLSNAEVLTEVKRFLIYAVSSGHRGTPHRV